MYELFNYFTEVSFFSEISILLQIIMNNSYDIFHMTERVSSLPILNPNGTK